MVKEPTTYHEDRAHCVFCDAKVLRSRSIGENEHFYFVEDLYPAAEQHFLIVAKSHVLAMAHLGPLSFTSLLPFASQLGGVVAINERIQLFERGNKERNVTDRPSLDHAHVHVFYGECEILQYLPSHTTFIDLAELSSSVANRAYYFHYDSSTAKVGYGNSADVPSQFIRKVVAKMSPEEQWNWRLQAERETPFSIRE